MTMHSCLSKTDYNNKFYIFELGDSPFYNLDNTHACRNNYQATFSVMENQGNSMNNIEVMKVDEHKLMLIKNNLHQ